MRDFASRHIGIHARDIETMLKVVGADSLEELISEVVPGAIRLNTGLDIPEAMTERGYLKEIRKLGAQNQVFRSYIGQGYYGTITPPVIQRNVFENPGWYTQYTPYQAEIAQGRLEALLNFQTMVSDLTALPVANASLLDEGTAAAEAMMMFYDVKNKKRKGAPNATKCFVDSGVFPQTIDVLASRARPTGVELEIGNWTEAALDEDYFAVILQYPDREGRVEDYRKFVERSHALGIFTIVVADLLSLAILTPPGEWGAHAVVGNTQRFGVPMGFGGPHAAFFATLEKYKRQIPGRIIGVSKDRRGLPALRMALQTREQHIRREKATSNICTAQALLAIMAGLYAVYHGPDGIRDIAAETHDNTRMLREALAKMGMEAEHKAFFDTLRYAFRSDHLEAIRAKAEANEVNFHYDEHALQIAIDETTEYHDLELIVRIFADILGKTPATLERTDYHSVIPPALLRRTAYLEHPVFNQYNTETEIMRYIKALENKDLSLLHSMIPLGSCTMKLNAASELMPVSWHQFAHVHPYAPKEQVPGYLQMIRELEGYLCEITGFEACSLMPNSGAQGELTGLLTIRAYHHAQQEKHRDIALIPSSAHGTNPASAVMSGMQVIVVACDDHGNIDLADLRQKAEKHKERLAALMVTYPSTHGVYESEIRTVCDLVHQYGGLVYMDGANMNAQVGLTNPASIGADVCHLNLHKTFAIPHGGGGPGMGPICANAKLAPYLPKHRYAGVGGANGIPAVASAPWGSASILPISYGYIKMLGMDGLKRASEIAILNANYLKSRLEKYFPILYTAANGRIAHEFILDLRDFKHIGVAAEDICKRLMDYGFHAPTLSFPVPNTVMIEPTESESLRELDRFCEAMINIKAEIDEIARGEADPENNVLKNAPHTIDMLMDDKWTYPYSREKAVYPLPWLYQEHKFWPSVARIDNAYGDRHLVCTCPPIESYQDQEV